MTSGKVTTVARQSAALLSAQVVLMVVQLGYTALTARVFSPAAFGSYAVASALTSIGSLLAVNGVAKAAARRPEDSADADRQLAGAALILSAVLALTLMLAAPLLARLWENPSASGLTAILACSIVPSAYAGVLVGVLRRAGRMTEVVLLTLAAGLIGIAVGMAAVLTSHSPLALGVLPVASAVAQAGLASARLGMVAVPLRPGRLVRTDVVYSLKSSGFSITTYAIYTTPLWVLSRQSGPAVLGAWNRAVAVTQVPVESVSRSWVMAAFPHFRYGPTEKSGRRAWSDLASASVWIALPVCLGLAPAVHFFVGVLLGPGWQVASDMAVWLWVAACVLAVVTVLTTAVESSGLFRVLWGMQAVVALVMLGGTAGIIATGDWRWLGASSVLSALAGWVALVISAHRHSLVHGGTVLRWSVSALLAAIVVAVLPLLVIARDGSGWASSLTAIAAVGAFLGISWSGRRRLPMLERLLRR
jgi:O-antigen/teichoic acid export membrane protein